MHFLSNKSFCNYFNIIITPNETVRRINIIFHYESCLVHTTRPKRDFQAPNGFNLLPNKSPKSEANWWCLSARRSGPYDVRQEACWCGTEYAKYQNTVLSCSINVDSLFCVAHVEKLIFKRLFVTLDEFDVYWHFCIKTQAISQIKYLLFHQLCVCVSGLILHEEHIELYSEDFKLLKKEVEGKVLQEGTLHFTG